jgi:iron complex outermembrane receptor protein
MLNRAAKQVIASAAAIIAAFGGEFALAQQGSGLEEITVTATRREQSLQDVGVSVTAFSDNQIRELGFTNTVDIVAMTPGLNYTVPNAESSQINFFLRGVGLNDFADAQENPVAVYVDDVYKPAMGGLHLQLFDMERVEVLRGPQGALFGRNTTGGVVHYISKRPTEEFEAYVDGSYGDFEQIKAEGAISGSFSDTVMGRLSLAYNSHDGWTENRTPGVQDYNGADSIAGRAQLLFTPSERVDILLSASYSDNDSEVGAWQHEATKFSADGNTSLALPIDEDFWGSGPGNDAFGYRDTDGDPWTGDYDRNGSVKVENTGFSANIEWTIGDLQLTAITAYTEVERLQEEDTDANPFVAFIVPGLDTSFVAPTFGAETETISQEFRIAGGQENFRWLGGFYYFDNEVDGSYVLDTTFLDFVLLDANYVQETESWALFGQVEYDFSEQWTLIAGLRWTDEQKEMDYENIDLFGTIAFCSTIDPAACGVPPTPISPTRPTADHAILFNKSSVGNLAEQDEDFWTGKVELDWKPNEEVLVYGSVSRGQKSPGFNSGFLDTTFY